LAFPVLKGKDAGGLIVSIRKEILRIQKENLELKKEFTKNSPP
jgi:hypothetical protein